jgi:hypothetical protein
MPPMVHRRVAPVQVQTLDSGSQPSVVARATGPAPSATLGPSVRATEDKGMAIQRFAVTVAVIVVEAFLFAGLMASGMGLVPGANEGYGPSPGSPVPLPSQAVR